jgi:uncharacterized protein
MINDRVARQRIKKILVVSIAVLSFILVGLWAYGFLFVKDMQIEKAAKLGQYYEFNSENLPSKPVNIQAIRKDISNDEDSISYPETVDSAAPSDNRPQITILVSNLGLNKNSTELALSLPKEIALGFLPYTTSLKPLITKAQELHHEIFIYLPFETKRYPMDSPGHLPLLLSLSDTENITRMNTLLKAFDKYIGVYCSYKEVFTSNPNKAYPIIDELKRHKLKLFLGHSNNDIAFSGESGIGFLSADIVLDREPNVTTIKENLDKLIKLAEANNYAVAYAEGYPVTIYTLKAWLPILEKRGIRLVPASQMIENIGNNAQQTDRSK